MEYLNKFYNLSNIIERLSNISFDSVRDITNSISSLSIQNNLKNENNNENFIVDFDYINNIIFLEPELERIYKIFFQQHLHLMSNEDEECEYNNHLSVLITYYNLLMKLVNEKNIELYKENLSFETLNDIFKYIETLNDNVLFDIQNNTYNDLDNIRKIIVSKIEYLVLLLIDKLSNFNNQIQDYQEITRIFFNTIQLIVYVLLYNY